MFLPAGRKAKPADKILLLAGTDILSGSKGVMSGNNAFASASNAFMSANNGFMSAGRMILSGDKMIRLTGLVSVAMTPGNAKLCLILDQAGQFANRPIFSFLNPSDSHSLLPRK
jgi:hypothetical protein